jgi:hypothetical protein
VRGAESGSILTAVPRALHMLGLGMSVGTPAGGITAEALAVRSFEELEALGREKVQGKSSCTTSHRNATAKPASTEFGCIAGGAVGAVAVQRGKLIESNIDGEDLFSLGFRTNIHSSHRRSAPLDSTAGETSRGLTRIRRRLSVQ